MLPQLRHPHLGNGYLRLLPITAHVLSNFRTPLALAGFRTRPRRAGYRSRHVPLSRPFRCRGRNYLRTRTKDAHLQCQATQPVLMRSLYYMAQRVLSIRVDIHAREGLIGNHEHQPKPQFIEALLF